MPPVQSRAPEERFVERGLLLIGFTVGLALGAVSDWPWWCYLTTPVIYLLGIVVAAIYELIREGRREH